MEREDLIKKWLDNELDSQELQAFQSLEDYEDLVKLSRAITKFKADDYNSDIELGRVQLRLHSTRRKKWLKPISRIAAILIVCVSVYFYTTSLDSTVSTLASNKTYVTLPDDSKVILNAMSSVTYNKKNWKHSRTLELEGEAYFKVAKGSKFMIETKDGIVSVLGTQFNVKQRLNYFEVVCYEGSVSVSHASEFEILKPGDHFLILEGQRMLTVTSNEKSPHWLNNESRFESVPYKFVLEEFERQYNVKIEAEFIDKEQRFTGKFGHNDLEIALKSITLPLHLTFSKTNNTIQLKRE